ncbi:DUF4362 domain-containing protein [Cohnella nanjingensis]|uniref:DUF4362 domain-containing protein n=1 Tax=Cohnella nanjingensis TaxID=1387779 RepID=A0A7X0RWB4_9BACL|nr:DUF4362 domain-containing protein [Cohnella nanjingensis]
MTDTVYHSWLAVLLKWLSASVVVLLLLTGCATRAQDRQGGHILTRFDRQDLATATAFVRHFKQHRGDRMMAVQQGLDSGPVIYDLWSDGKTIEVRIDDSRDIYSDRNQTTFTCKNAEIARAWGKKQFQVSSCEGVEGGGAWLFAFDGLWRS